MAEPPILTLNDISLTFGGTPLLSGAALAVHPGERIALVGRNGSGKSTLMKMMAGRVQPDTGVVFVNCSSALDREQQDRERALELRSQDGEERLNVAETKLVLARALWASGGDLGRALELATSARDLAGAVEPSDDEGFQRLLGGADVPRLTDLLVPAGLGATNRNTRGR